MIGDIEVVRLRRILSSQRVNLFHNGQDAELLAAITHQQHGLVHRSHLALHANGTGYLEVGEAIDLGLAQQISLQRVDILLLQTLIDINDMLQLLQEPAVNLRQFMNLVDIVFGQVHRLRDDEDTLIRRLTQSSIDVSNFQLLVLHEAVHALTNHTQALLDSLLEGTADSHHLAHRLHAGAQLLVHAVELREVPTGNLTDDVVESRLEEGAGGLGHRVLQFEESVAHTQLSSDKRQGIACGLRSQSRRARQTGVHLDDAIVLRLRVEGILHVTLADDTDVTDNLDGQRTQLMVFRVCQRLRRSDDNRLTGMDAQGVEVLHVTDGYTVVVAVTNHLVLNLLPALQRLLNKHLRREGEGLFGQAVQLLLIVAEAGTKTTQGIGSTDNDGITQTTGCLTGLLDGLTSLALNGLDTNLVELLDEELAVLSIHNGLDRSAQHLDIIFLEHTALIQLDATVQCRLSTESQQDAVRTLLLNDFLNEIGLYGQEINLVGNALGGLHRSDIRIDEHCLDALFTQGFQCL